MQAGEAAEVPPDEPRHDVNLKDDNNCTPLHLAILNGHLEAMRVLLQAGARVFSKCEGSLPLHMAVCTGALADREPFAVAAITLLVEHGAIVLDRDDHGRTALHWAAAGGLADVTKRLLHIGRETVERIAARNAEDLTENGNRQDKTHDSPPQLPHFQDKQGNTALHLAARYRHADVVRLLLEESQAEESAGGSSVIFAIKQKNKSALNVMHMAALGGDAASVAALMGAAPVSVLKTTTRQGLTPTMIASKRGHAEAATLLGTDGGTPAGNDNSNNNTPRANGGRHQLHGSTLIMAPPECLDHHTAPWPILRGGPDPPPENVNRLTVLTNSNIGILKTREFGSGLIRWDERQRRAALGDIIRVHDWAYVRKIQMVCEKLPDDPSDVGHLDGDTAISRRTYVAALAAAGAVTHAVDELMTGKARNAFCAVRPPGHHAGPHGVVTCANDPHGSHGFCLFNNVAIGAAYAMTVYRHSGIKRVAILDFDVHHGNGTEACVANTAPSLDKFAFSTPYGDGLQQFPVYKPWHDVDDKDNVFFASVQGYGPKMPGVGAFVYPGSGATCDTRAIVTTEVEVAEVPLEVEGEALAMDIADRKPEAAVVATTWEGKRKPNRQDDPKVSAAHAAEGDVIIEDPDHEFTYDGGEMPRTEGPRIIDVGIPGPGARVALWRRAWRDKILPALVKFDPDMIFVSAGFDAHKKDDINFSYIGVQERDYEWLTDQIVQVANRCCQGRVVSILEGGYRIQGGLISAFARSVAAHVRALADAHSQAWDPRDAKWERDHEKELRAEAEAKRAASKLAAEAANEEAAMANQGLDEAVPAAPEEEEGAGRRKRQRSAVDYVALNKKLEEEAAAAKGGG